MIQSTTLFCYCWIIEATKSLEILHNYNEIITTCVKYAPAVFARTFLPMWELLRAQDDWGMSKKTAQVIIRKGNRGHNWTSMFYLPNTGQHFKSRAKQRTLTLSFTDAGMQTCSLKKLTGRSTTVTVCNFRRKFLEADCHSKKHKSTDPSTVTLLNGRSRLLRQICQSLFQKTAE